jgi:hypothetical protein
VILNHWNGRANALIAILISCLQRNFLSGSTSASQSSGDVQHDCWAY